MFFAAGENHLDWINPDLACEMSNSLEMRMVLKERALYVDRHFARSRK